MLSKNVFLEVEVSGPGLCEITDEIVQRLESLEIESSLLTLFIRHTSASLIIQENADPSAKRDLESWLDRLVPENDELFTHIAEGADDMPAHIKSMLTSVSLPIPIADGRPVLGVWQGIFLWEHRNAETARRVVLNILGTS